MRDKIEITEKKSKRYIAVYGTLRTGYGNWKRCLEGRSVYLGTFQTAPNYTMYTNGGFPIVVDKGNTSITYELMEIEDKNTLERVHSLEGCSGIPGHEQNWYDIQRIDSKEHPDKEIYMYMMHEPQNLRIIESGNFNDN